VDVVGEAGDFEFRAGEGEVAGGYLERRLSVQLSWVRGAKRTVEREEETETYVDLVRLDFLRARQRDVDEALVHALYVPLFPSVLTSFNYRKNFAAHSIRTI
jgi:hypothetical protein